MMTPEDAAKLLAVAGAFDQRLTPPSRDDALARALAWAEALHPSMPAGWARDEVVAHYAQHTTVIMPAHLNTRWKAHRHAMLVQESAERVLEAVSAEGVPMPDYVKEVWQGIGRGVDAE